MDGYEVFARYYDALTANVDYDARAAYLLELIQRLNHPAGLTLDLACGTGSLTMALRRRGVDAFGADSSAAMLTEAQNKAAAAEESVLFLCQKMEKLDLFGTVDTVFCALDSINHLAGEAEVLASFRRAAFFLNDDGWFIFDVNTPYKHAHVLADRTFVYDLPDIYCVWQNHYSPRDGSVSISLDFFARQNSKLYARSSTRFSERAYPEETLRDLLRQAGFDRVEFYGDMTFAPPEPEAERWVVAAHITHSLNAFAE